MKYQDLKNIPSLVVKLKHGLLIAGQRYKTARVRVSFGADRSNLISTNDAKRNFEYYANITTLEGFDGDLTVEMMENLSDTDFVRIVEASKEADELELDPKLPSGSLKREQAET
jgi:hypothetical protein